MRKLEEDMRRTRRLRCQTTFWKCMRVFFELSLMLIVSLSGLLSKSSLLYITNSFSLAKVPKKISLKPNYIKNFSLKNDEKDSWLSILLIVTTFSYAFEFFYCLFKYLFGDSGSWPNFKSFLIVKSRLKTLKKPLNSIIFLYRSL